MWLSISQIYQSCNRQTHKEPVVEAVVINEEENVFHKEIKQSH